MAALRSKTLFHFTKSLPDLKSILKNGFYPRYSLESIAWMRLPKKDAVAFPIVCFCDIPLGRISDHIRAYTSLGIGMSQAWGRANGLNPLLYVSPKSDVVTIAKRTLKAALSADKATGNTGHAKNFRRLLSFMKPTSGMQKVRGKRILKQFYLESEWRYLAIHKQVRSFLSEADYADKVKRKNWNSKAAKLCPLTFTPKDVRYIFLEDEDDVPDLVNFITREMSRHPYDEVLKLTTRIICQDTIDNDL